MKHSKAIDLRKELLGLAVDQRRLLWRCWGQANVIRILISALMRQPSLDVDKLTRELFAGADTMEWPDKERELWLEFFKTIEVTERQPARAEPGDGCSP